MANTQSPQSSSQEVSKQSGLQKPQSASGGMTRRSFDPFFASPWELMRSNPFTLMRRMSEEMDNMFRQGMRSGQDGGSAFWTPAIDIAERDGKFVITAELPGAKPEDVKVEMNEDAIVIEGERKSEHEENQGGVHRSERRYGHFYRSIPLPEGVDAEQVNARFENGVLEITAPVQEQKQNRRQIPVRAGGAESSTQTKGVQSEGTQTSGQQNKAA